MVKLYRSVAPMVSMLPAPVAGVPLATVSPVEIANVCGLGTAHALKEYVPVVPVLATVSA